MNKKLSTAIIIAMLAFAAYFFIKGDQASDSTPANVYKSSAPPPAQVTTPVTDAPASAAPVASNSIIRTDIGFSPNVITIKQGETVAFKNESSDPMWPASDPHPAHTGYPAAGGCRSSAFDACKGIAPGDSWSFAFDDAGSWNFHDHLSPQFKGTIIVK